MRVVLASEGNPPPKQMHYDETNNPFVSVSDGINTRCGYGFGVPESTPAGSCVFPSDPEPESKICEKTDTDPESFFIFSSRGLCGFHMWHFLAKTLLIFGCMDGSRSLNRSRILKFENFRTWIRIQKFWNRSGVGVWKCDYGHLCLPEGPPI